MAGINTKNVAGRRSIHFENFDDILADIERLAKARQIRTLGNWSAGQVFQHLAIVMDGSIDGVDFAMSAPLRWFFRLFIKKKMLRGAMPAGIKLPAKAEQAIVPAATSLEEGLRDVRRALQRLKSDPRRAPSPVFGPMTHDEWTQLHCRHAELHLSFLLPVDVS